MKFILVFLAVVLFSSASFADCYTMDEAEAEQGIRIHSELMVIGLNCQHLWPKNEPNLYLQYKQFSAKNGDIFSGYEATLMKHFRNEYGAAAEAHMHTLRTQFANKISGDAATMRPDAFCKVYAPRIPKAATMDRAAIHKWASTFFPGFPTTQPICRGSVSVKFQ